MKKILLTSLIVLSIVFWCFSSWVSALEIPGGDPIKQVSHSIDGTGDAVSDIQWLATSIYTILKRLLMGVMVIYTVYIGAMMIMSMGSDEEQLSSSKRQLWYMLVALIFINIPERLFFAFSKNSDTVVWNTVEGSFNNANSETSQNLFFDFLTFSSGINNQIMAFLEIMVALAALFMITLAGIQLMTSRGKEEKMGEAKNKIVYSVLALIFVGIIESWKQLAFGGSIAEGINLFESLANLALFFAAPVAIFFLTLAGYYYITSNGDEERIKKSKSIVINTLLAILILIASYTLLIDLADFPSTQSANTPVPANNFATP